MGGKTVDAKPALVLRNKLALVVGTHNGVDYSEDEVRKLFQLYKQIEAKPITNRSIDEVHAFDIHRGDDEDHKDSTGTWVGDVGGVYWDNSVNGFGFKEWRFVEEDFAKKIKFQKSRGKSSFGVSPRLNVLRVGTKATEILPKNLSIVLTPAGGEQLMLSESEKENEEGRELRQDIVTELTLSEQETISTGGKKGMEIDEKKFNEMMSGISGLTTFLQKQEEQKLADTKAADEKSLKEKDDKIAELNKQIDELAKKKEDEEKMAAKNMKDDKKKGKEGEEGMQKPEKGGDGVPGTPPFPSKDKKLAGEGDKKYKYYGALGARDSLLSKFNITPDVTKLDAVSINRVADDLSSATKIFSGEFTLEQAQKGIEELSTILVNLPRDEKEEEALAGRIEETLAASFGGNKGLKQTETPGLNQGGRRKGLIGNEGEREDATLSRKQEASTANPTTADDIREDMTNTIMESLGMK